MKPARNALTLLLSALLLSALFAPGEAQGQTYRKTWTTTADFGEGPQVNVNATAPPNQLQLNLSGIETPYLWVANTGSGTVTRIATATGRALSVSNLGGGQPSRTAVDLDFNCWVGTREQNGRVFKLRATDGAILGNTQKVGNYVRGVAITANGDVWASTSCNNTTATDCSNGEGNTHRWALLHPETLAFQQTFNNTLGSYGLAINPFGKVFSSTSWLGGASVQRVNSETGQIEQRWRVTHLGGDIYGITVDINGDAWGAIWANEYVVWIDGDYQCPNGALDCTITQGSGIHRNIDVSAVLAAAGAENGGRNAGGRGIAVDANGFVWAVFNNNTDWTVASSYAVKIDGRTGTPLLATYTGSGSIGITPDADGYIWVVNYNGRGTLPLATGYTCPNGFNAATGGAVTKLRSSDGSVVATYPTCGNNPYTYSDMAGYALRSVTLRSGNWRVVHDSGRAGLEWGLINWSASSFDDTVLRVRVRSAETQGALAALPFVEVTSGSDLPLVGRFLEVEAFFFTRNDFIGPVLYDLTASSVCIADPAGEVCNGYDDDCNGIIDDGNPGGGQACSTGLQGVCSSGVNTCVNGEYRCIAALNPMDEQCDGEDNNCDGRVDEGVLNACGSCGAVPSETCDTMDNDCDGAVDEGVLNACGSCGAAPMERCDGEDNNCNGLIDEGLTNLCGTCGAAPIELCDESDNDCDGLVDEGVTNNCGVCGAEPAEECDNIDNNCNGLIDEGLRNLCGTCGPAPAEVCNGQDDDCDGVVDDGVLNACGFCGAAPAEVCDGLDNNCDGVVDEGVANACGGCGEVPREVCNGIDDNCDGVTDEGVTNRCGTCGLEPEEICDRTDNDCDGQIDEQVVNACGGCGPLGPDACDGIDNDCDGQRDEDPGCVENRTCVRGECAERCAAGECPPGFYCSPEGFCLADRCIGVVCPSGDVCQSGECLDSNEVACQGVECGGDDVCVSGECVPDPCDGVACDTGLTCWLGECQDSAIVACKRVECAQGELCDEGTCVVNPCAGVRCAEGEMCQDGACIDACEQTQCSTGFTCRLGQCVPDLCFNTQCTDGRVCYLGNCIYEGCENVSCGDDEQCGPAGCEPFGTCGDTVCPEGETCSNGVCRPESNGQGNNNDGPNNDGPNNGNGDNNGGNGNNANPAGSDGGCGCSTTTTNAAHPALLLLLLGLAALVTRRRS